MERHPDSGSVARRWLARAACAALTLALAYALFTLYHGAYEHGLGEAPANLGNAVAKALLAKRPGAGGNDDFTFAVIGDINTGMENFELVVERLRAEPNVEFLVLLGDCAADPAARHHRFFRLEFAETGLELPTFIVAGNHDIGDGFGPKEFEQDYGPVNFHFGYRDCLFIGLGGTVVPELREATLHELEGILRKERGRYRRCFVFMHYSPPAAVDIPTSDFPGAAQFGELFERYRVDYVLSGHYHRLARTQVGPTAYLVSGGGGARLRHDKFGDVGLFHHLLLFQVRPGSVAEQVFQVEPVARLEKLLAKLESRAATEAWPFLRRWWPLLLPAWLAALALALPAAAGRRRPKAVASPPATPPPA
ncbi:MAG: metallophosphoesterase [Lentisphaeria bacterium]|jgi:predicted phosphodiesterase